MNANACQQTLPDEARRFALEVVRKLRASGHEALWAGGCVRDQLMGRAPKDYDVATSAQPDVVQSVFGRNRTHAVGAAFGVVTVLGPRGAGQVEVATFRKDEGYSDGRRPDAVTFSNAREDALRRDFTINGLFYDPVADEIIDYVGGRQDLESGILRAIGDPRERFQEDKLRLLRAVRFAARFSLQIDQSTWQSLCAMSDQITVVSPERIAAEMRLIVVDPYRVRAWNMLRESQLLRGMCAELMKVEEEVWQASMAISSCLQHPSFSLAMAAALAPLLADGLGHAIGKRWRLANHEIDRITWLLRNWFVLRDAHARPWSHTQRVLAHDGGEELVALFTAMQSAHFFSDGSPIALNGTGAGGWGSQNDAIAFAKERLAWPIDRRNPSPLITGQDLMEQGCVSGPAFRPLLEAIRNAQLDGIVQTKEQALDMAIKLYHGEG